MATEKQTLAATKDKFFSLRAKLILIFSILSAFVSFITARGIYTNMRSQFVDEFRTQFITQSTFIILIAVGLGIFFGYVAGNVLTESIIKLTKGAKDFALGDMNQRIELDTQDEINDLASAFNSMADNIQ